MDIKNLETASDYINNLLLSRGLLRNGEPICFAHPSQDEGGKQATITKVINLVHDLILRRDVRNAAHVHQLINTIQRESEIMVKLSQDVVNLRNTSSQHTQTIQKLESHNAEIGRQLALKSASEKTATMALKSAEARTKVLKEDMSRLKATVGQIRAQCANDVRKKEVELRRLQKYLELKRGREGSVQVGVAVVNPGTTLLGSSSNQAYKQTSLFQETIDHLTHVSRELSTENQVLRMLVQSTISTLQDLQGIPSVSAADEGTSDDMVSQFNVVPCTVFEANITEILTQLRSLLTNPSFVSLEEVHVREEEIVRLREGWEKMEARWREALSLMHSWRKRMMETGDAINLDDLRKGLVLGSTPITLPPTSVRKGRVSIGQMPSPDNSTVEDQSAATSLDQQEMGSATMSLDRWTNSKSLASSDQQEESPQRRSGNNTSPVIECSNQRQEVGIFPAPRILHPTTGNSRGLPRPLQMHPKRYSNDLDVLHKPSNKSPHKRHRSSQVTFTNTVTAPVS